MQTTEIVEWVKSKFCPDPLVLQDSAVMMRVSDAVDYWNNHSAYRVKEQFDIQFTSTGSAGTVRRGWIQLNTKFKFVTRVFPQKLESSGLNYNPENMMMGLYVTNRFMTEDFVQWRHWLNGWKTYANANFRTEFQESADPLVTGGKVYMQSIPFYTTKATVEGALRIFANEDIKDPQIYAWVREYVYALCLEQQGKAVRKGSMIGITNDGDSMVHEGTELRLKLEEDLKQSGRWMLLMQRG